MSEHERFTKGFSLEQAVHWVPAVLWMGVIFYFSSQTEPVPGVADSKYEDAFNFLAHMGEYAGLMFWLLWGWTKGELLRAQVDRRVALASFSMSVAYALSDELHQLLVPGRTFSLFDLGVDGLGAVLTLIMVRKVQKLISAKTDL